jgi:Arylsulfotransferase (ASST)
MRRRGGRKRGRGVRSIVIRSIKLRILNSRGNDLMGLPVDRLTHLATRIGVLAATTAALLLVALLRTEAIAQAPGGDTKGNAGPAGKDRPGGAQPAVKLGLSINEPGAFRGYTVLNPMGQKTVYLFDLDGRVVHSWSSQHSSMHPAYLLPDGHLFRVANAGDEMSFGGGGGSAGRMQELTWDGEVLWDFKMHNPKQLQHHDAIKLPNGNVLMVVWEKKTAEEAIAAGRKKDLVSKYILPDSVLEVKPTGKTTGDVVWEWHLWDHVIQDHDSTKANFGDVAAHPELVDINFVENPLGPGPGGPPPGAPQAKTAVASKDAAKDARSKAEAEKLKSIGYVGAPAARAQRANPDWTHVNSIDFNAAFDQIVLSVHELSEIWIIDHSTTTALAAGHSGGRSGKGGDLLYRWGNPRAYRAGTHADQRLFAQHNANWIRPGLPGAGHMLVFNNGGHRSDGDYSSVDELVLPVDEQGRYSLESAAAYGPEKAHWSYSAPKKSDFYAFFISGAQRLPNGNTLICSGPNGTLFEVTQDKQIVWKYVNPVKGGFGPGRGGPGGAPPPPNQVLVSFVQDRLGLSADQKKQVSALQKTVDETLESVLTADQKKNLRERTAPGPGGMGAMTPPGQIIATTAQITLKPTPEQKTRLSALQKEVDSGLEKTLTGDQKETLKELRADFARGGPGGGPPGGGPRGGPGGGPGGPPPGGPPGGPAGGGPPAFLFTGPPGGASLFRAYRYGPDYAGLSGKDLKPGKTVEEMQPKDQPASKGAEKSKDAVKK